MTYVYTIWFRMIDRSLYCPIFLFYRCGPKYR